MPRLTHASLFELHLPLAGAVNWTVGGTESAVPYLVVLLHDDAGRIGGAEITCRPSWNAMTPGLLARAFADIAWPRLTALDLPETAGNAALTAADTALTPIRGATALRAVADNAWRDLLAPAAPASDSVKATVVLTRDVPEAMADAALQARDEMGVNAFKVKLGQSIETDTAVLEALRKTLGEQAELSGDANSSYSFADLSRLWDMARDLSLDYLEDPCPLWPDLDAFMACAAAPVPVVADKPIENARIAETLVRMGLSCTSAKPSRIGTTEALDLARRLGARNGRIVNGTYSESAFGAHAQIAFAQSLPPGLAWPHEVVFHRELTDQFAPPPRIEDGYAAPVAGRATDAIDLDALGRLATASHRLTA